MLGPKFFNKPNHTARFPLMIYILIAIYTKTVIVYSHRVLHPYKTGVSQVALVIIPQFGLESESYEELGVAIQRSSPFELWVGISTKQSRTLGEVGEAIEEIREELRYNGAQTKDYFLAGHGKSGLLIQTYANDRSESFKGIILYGACLSSQHPLSTYPLPVLTLSGDLDGINRITRMVDAFDEILTSTLDADVFLRSPVIVLEGLNHGSYISTELPGALKLFDIEAEVSHDNALQKIGNTTVLFIMHSLQMPEEELESIKFHLEIAYSNTFTTLLPIIEARTYALDENSESYWVRTAQVWFTGATGADSSRFQVKSYVMDEDSLFLPTVNDQENGVIAVTTFSEVIYPSSRHSYGAMPQEPTEIRARMIGMEKFQLLLSNMTFTYSVTCRDINYASFLNAYYLASSAAQRRYDAKNTGILFDDDIELPDEAQWKNTQLLVYTDGREIHVTSMAWKTSMQTKPTYRQGLQYCKLLPPSRAIEWIYVDALRDEFLIE